MPLKKRRKAKASIPPIIVWLFVELVPLRYGDEQIPARLEHSTYLGCGFLREL